MATPPAELRAEPAPADGVGPRIRCAPFHEELHVDPAGSAAHSEAFLCVEVPGPWARDVAEHEPYRSLRGGGSAIVGPDGRTWRPQALAVTGRSTDRDAARRTVLAFDRPGGAGARAGAHRRREWAVEPARLGELCAAVVAEDRAALAAFDAERREVGPEVLDLLVCTHGRRDVCCGSLGTSLHARLVDPTRALPGLRVWRTSHTGGHRFAPTGLSFPDGLAWAHLDEGVVAALLQRDDADLAQVSGHCRGTSALRGGAAQVADRAAFDLVGWSWLRAERSLSIAPEPLGDGSREVLLAARWPQGHELLVRAVVAVGASAPQPPCGGTADEGTGSEAVWEVRSVAVVDPLTAG